MNKISCGESANFDDDLLSEYRFDYHKAKPNRFAAQSKQRMTVVVLDDEVAQVFTTPESVNKALKTLIDIVPQSREKPDRLRE